ncbi:hypothetical protein K437DRAFT_271470 [Tilletiaria anomala UBC 951]|uniref:DNA/RNA-binding domain-containing protein n=1 Tax=Tilletiaria anomala (strain ATCC 24038 / CBS 436.72 / UBC 951) TaxID=1037660 RepID=A0A066WLS0_TILAU|nr:uncharacterized protein K437DRAFT_271470 [Tilletiaria anomala UBC 951]KDN53543.1 hypothetical protein K437DRAFT_271470 [Tilletiaria anomala UBC 951]
MSSSRAPSSGTARSSPQLLQEAKQLKASLKALLEESHAKPSSGEVEFARKNLRNTLLNLLFGHPFTRDSHGIDVFLWIETTHPLVASYRALLSDLKKVIHAGKVPYTADGNDAAAAQPALNKSAKKQKAAEYSKTLSDFRKFLAAEETFWQELASRVVRVFGLEEARVCLEALDIPCDDNVSASDATWTTSGDMTSAAFDRSARVAPAPREVEGDVKYAAQQPSNRHRLLDVMHKALICCGDLARYREMYNEPQSRSEGPQTNREGKGVSKCGRGGSNGQRLRPVLKKAEYSRAVACYEQARTLLPNNGNPSNQIAVIAMYHHDHFSAVYHYYRALCVKTPFDSARQNLESTFKKALGLWRNDGASSAKAVANRKRDRTTDIWLPDFVALHAMFYLRASLKDMLVLAGRVHANLAALLRDRALQTDQVVHLIVIALSASWTARLWKSSASSKSDATSNTNPAALVLERRHRLSVELQIMSHVLVLFKVLADISRSECDEAVQAARDAGTVPMNQKAVSTNITAVFRRMLPALRICNKWIKSHLDYVQRSTEKAAKAEEDLRQALQGATNYSVYGSAKSDQNAADQSVIENVTAFWRSYTDFMNSLRFAFPYDMLPVLGSDGPLGVPSLCLEEDLDMRGFAPIKRAMIPFANAGMGDAYGVVRSNEAHPNEEQLMRISDLLVDAKVIAESSASPIVYDDLQNAFFFPADVIKGKRQLPGVLEKPKDAPTTDGMSEGASEATEDVVDLAMQAVDRREGGDELSRFTAEEEEEDEHILIPQVAKPQAHPLAGMLQQPSSAFEDAGRGPAPATAQDLLLQVLNGPKQPSTAPPGAEHSTALRSQASALPRGHMLFGGIGSSQHSSLGPSSNIWSPGPGDAHRLTPGPGESAWRSDANASPLPPPGHPAASAFHEAFSTSRGENPAGVIGRPCAPSSQSGLTAQKDTLFYNG